MSRKFTAPANLSNAPRRVLRCGLLLLLTLSLPAGTLVAQTGGEAKKAAADKLRDEAMQLFNEGTKTSLEQAAAKLVTAAALYHDAADTVDEAVTLNNIGLAHRTLGERQKALDYFNRALPLLHAAGDKGDEAATLDNVGLIYDDLGDPQKGLDYYNQSLLLEREIKDRAGEARALNNVGTIYEQLGEPQKALDYFNQALPLSRDLGDSLGAGVTLSNIGLIEGELGELHKALDHLIQSVALLHAAGDQNREAWGANHVGTFYGALGEQRDALNFFNQALQRARATGDRRLEALVLDNMAYSERALGNLNSALARSEASVAVLESLRADIGSQDLRSSFFATVQEYYELYIDVLMRLHRRQPGAGYDGRALQASERERARSLLELLAEAGADIRQGVDAGLLERERALRQQLDEKASQQTQLLSAANGGAQSAAVAKEIDALTTEYQQVEAQIRQTSPRYAALTQPQPLTLKEIQTEVLDADTLLLEYSLGDDRSYLWAVTPTSVRSYELPKRGEVEAAARDVYALFSSEQAWAQSRGQRGTEIVGAGAPDADAAARLSRMLLAPVADQLGKKRLLIVGDGALQFIPFGALPVPTVPDNKKGDYQPLITEHEIVALPSASTLAVLRRETQGRQPAAKTLAVLADPVFESTDARIKTPASKAPAVSDASLTDADRKRETASALENSARESGLRESGLTLPRLPGTRDEAQHILSLAPADQSKQALDFAASRETATAADMSQYRYVHFATHGFLNSLHPELSGIALSMFDERGEPRDGFLRLNDIFNLKLSADMVVLSACQTGLGKEVKGEGLVGLTRGFMYAGTPRVVVSLWSVSDEATAELMTRFYKGVLVDKLRPAQALQAAQVSMIKDKKYGAPFYWAAFTLQGEWR